LGDHAAAEAVDRIDYDFKRVHRAAQPWANQFLVALRAKKLDEWAAEFLRRHPDAVVLHLGCGLTPGCSESTRRRPCSGSTSISPAS
jgi:O-methyltransferase involved in polyketide biosynthesis